MKKKNKKNEQDNVYNSNTNIIVEDTNVINKTLAEVEEVLLKTVGNKTEILSTYIYLLCNSDMEHYKRTVDLLQTIEKFKKKLGK